MRLIGEDKPMEADAGFCDEIARASGQDIEACYQCAKCTAGCPMARAMDLMPNQVIRAVQLGLKDLALEANAVWYCAGCETCASRCPRDIDMARVNKALARMCVREKRTPKDPAVAAFHQSFMESVARWGRAHELEVIGLTKLRDAGQRFKDIGLGQALFTKGRLAILPHRVKHGAQQVREIIQRDAEGGAALQPAPEADTKPPQAAHH
jgi:heterodisulfide reductase subunit C